MSRGRHPATRRCSGRSIHRTCRARCSRCRGRCRRCRGRCSSGRCPADRLLQGLRSTRHRRRVRVRGGSGRGWKRCGRRHGCSSCSRRQRDTQAVDPHTANRRPPTHTCTTPTAGWFRWSRAPHPQIHLQRENGAADIHTEKNQPAPSAYLAL